MKHRRLFSTVALTVTLMFGWTLDSAPLWADETLVAVAANFNTVARDIAAAFEAETGDRAVLSFGSTGKLLAQIANGAPFQLFLAADAKHPIMAESQGLTVAGTRFTYAIGQVVLYSTNPTLVDDKGNVLGSPEAFVKLAMANPKTAPYGTAALETMMHMGVYDRIKEGIVLGENIAQAYQFVATGNAQLGFVALSQVIHNDTGSKWVVPAHLHTPIKQDAVLLKTGANSTVAKAFMTFLKGARGRAIIQQYGYGFE